MNVLNLRLLKLYRLSTRIVLVVVSFALFLAPGTEAGNAPAARNETVTLYLFWGRGCPHCAEEEGFLKTLQRKYPELQVKEFEVWYDRENAAFFSRAMQAAGVRRAGVPGTVIGNRLFLGFDAQTGKSLEEAVALCLKEGCADALKFIADPRAERPREEHRVVNLPLFGEIDPARISLPLFTVIIGALDSFNPCAFFVLLFLLSMLIHARSRKKMLLIGGVFVFFSGLVYFLFMAAWLNVFLIIGQLTAITVTAGVVALVVASINIKDFFFFKKGVSLVLPEKAKTRLFERMRNLLSSPNLPAMAAGTVVLAVTANAYELLCTAGFPMVYTRALTLQKLTTLQYYLYLVFYNIVYIAPLSLIVLMFTLSLGAKKMTEWQGRQLKLLSGLMMFLLGLVLLVNPALLNNVMVAIALLAAVLIASGTIIYAMKKYRPEIGAE